MIRVLRETATIFFSGLALFAALAILTLGFILATGGCAQSPHAEWATARQTLTATQNTILTLHQAGRLTDADLKAADPFVRAAQETLKQALAALPTELNAPSGEAFERYMAAFQIYITSLDAIQKRAAAPPPADTPPPSPAPTPSKEPTNGPQRHPRYHDPLQARRPDRVARAPAAGHRTAIRPHHARAV